MTKSAFDHFHTPLLSPKELKQKLPASDKSKAFIAGARQQIADILDDKQERILLIIGPCSIHDHASALEYATRLHELSSQVSQSFKIVMRTYFEKPRTALGWKGMLYDPHLNGSHDLEEGLHRIRKLLLMLAEMELPAATEFLDPISHLFFGDLISWACIGARTAESQVHRQFASGLSMPVAFKNSTSGSVEVAINGALTAAIPHTFFGMNDDGQISIVRTNGNRHPHIALRGGNHQPNYQSESLEKTLLKLQKAQLPARLVIDCSHDNCSRRYEEQINVFRSLIAQYLGGNKAIKGLALESHLYAGSQQWPQAPSELRYAVSLTDPCLDWKATAELILWAHHEMSKQKSPALQRCGS